jgi:hypothetical protein
MRRSSPPAVLLRESYREGGKVRKRTLANLSRWPPEKVEALRRVLRGETMVPAQEAFEVRRSLPHGHVAAVLGTLRKLGLERLIASRRSRFRDLVVAMVVARVVAPRSKLATARGLDQGSALSTLGETLGLGEVSAEELYGAMDWLRFRQDKIEAGLAARHLREGSLVLYDVSSTYFEGRHCPLAAWGHSRDHRGDRPQVVFGLLTSREGCPVAVEVFSGDTADPTTLPPQVEKLRSRFGLGRVVVVGDRGMVTSARIREDLRPAGLEWITALRSPQIRGLVEAGAIQLSLFDETDLAQITHPDYPGERLVVCRNPRLAAERARKRQELLRATEAELDKVVAATQRGRRPLRGRTQIALRVGRVLARSKMRKHFRLEIDEEGFSYRRREDHIAQEAALDGIYVIRTSVPEADLPAPQVVLAYKDLAGVERAFRTCKGIDLRVRPIYHRLAERVRAHIFLCMLAYYLEWHMRRALAPLLFSEEDPEAAEKLRGSPVAPAQRSLQARRKVARKRTDDGLPVRSFGDLLADLATICKNQVEVAGITFERITTPTSFQQQALDLLGVSPKA